MHQHFAPMVAKAEPFEGVVGGLRIEQISPPRWACILLANFPIFLFAILVAQCLEADGLASELIPLLPCRPTSHSGLQGGLLDHFPVTQVPSDVAGGQRAESADSVRSKFP